MSAWRPVAAMGSPTDAVDPRCGVHGPWMGQVESWTRGLRRAAQTGGRAMASRERLAGDRARDCWRLGSAPRGMCRHHKYSPDLVDAGGDVDRQHQVWL